MKYTQTRGEGVQRWGDITTLDYTVNTDTALLFHTVRHKLYANKHDAPIREYLTNAGDAHQDTGVPLEEIQLHFPTAKDPFFRVRDFGPGLNDAGMDTFVTYFETTKDTSNLYTGQKGLGCKSAFACSNEFFVTSFFDSVATKYHAHIDSEQDKGLLDVISTQPSSEATGLFIEVPIRQAEIAEFRKAGDKVLAIFGFRPKHNLTSISPLKVLLQGKNWQLLSELPGQERGAFIRMGNVTYPIDYEHPDLLELKGWFQYNFLIDVSMGSVHVSPNRESLEYTPLTLETLAEVVQSIRASSCVDLQAKLEARKHIFSALRLLYTHSEFLELSPTELTFRGLPVRLPSTTYTTGLSLRSATSAMHARTDHKPSLTNMAAYLLPRDTLFGLNRVPVMTEAHTKRVRDLLLRHHTEINLIWLPEEEYSNALLQGIPTLDSVRAITSFKAKDGITNKVCTIKKSAPRVLYTLTSNKSNFRWSNTERYHTSLQELLDAPFVYIAAPDPADKRFIPIESWMQDKLQGYLPWDISNPTRSWIFRNLRDVLPHFYRLGYTVPNVAPKLQATLREIFSKPISLPKEALALLNYPKALGKISKAHAVEHATELADLEALSQFFQLNFANFKLSDHSVATKQRLMHLMMSGGKHAFAHQPSKNKNKPQTTSTTPHILSEAT